MKVLCIGHACYDQSIIMDSYPTENVKYRVNERIECGGGPASTAAYLLGTYKVPTVFQGVVGNDIFGRRIIKEFKEINVETKYIEINNKFDTPSSFIIINKEKGTRTVFNYASFNPILRNNEYDFYPDFILIDGHNYRGSKIALEKFKNATTIIDAGRCTKEVIELAKMVDYLVCSKDFAEKFTEQKIDYENDTTLTNIYELLEKAFKNKIIITLENKGCLIKEQGKYKMIGSLKVPVIDTTGAGDIFHGAFVYALTQNMSLIACCKFANIVASLSITKIGTRNSIPDLNKVKEIYLYNEKEDN